MACGRGSGADAGKAQSETWTLRHFQIFPLKSFAFFQAVASMAVAQGEARHSCASIKMQLY
jgi:hypothetical protein